MLFSSAFSVFSVFSVVSASSSSAGASSFLILVDAVLKSQIFSVDVLEQNIVHHLLGEFLVLDASVFDEWVIIRNPSISHHGRFAAELVKNFLEMY